MDRGVEVKAIAVVLCLGLTACTLPDYINSSESLERQFTTLSEGDCNLELGPAPTAPDALADWQSVYKGCVNEKKSGYYARKARSEQAAINDSAKELAAHAALVIATATVQAAANVRVTSYNINGHKWTCWTTSYSVTCK